MAYRVCSLDSNLKPGLLLSDGCAICRTATSSDIFDPDGHNVAAAKLAVDRQIEHGKVASSSFDLEFGPN